MSTYKEFTPQNEEERQWVEDYNALSKYISEKLKDIDEKDRFTVLKDLNPSDPSLMNLFLQSLKNENYEICKVAKKLLKERGLEFQSEKFIN